MITVNDRYNFLCVVFVRKKLIATNHFIFIATFEHFEWINSQQVYLELIDSFKFYEFFLRFCLKRKIDASHKKVSFNRLSLHDLLKYRRFGWNRPLFMSFFFCIKNKSIISRSHGAILEIILFYDFCERIERIRC